MKSGHLDIETGRWVDETPADDDEAFAAEQALHPPVGSPEAQSGAPSPAAAMVPPQAPLSPAEKARMMQFVRTNAGNPNEVSAAREQLLRSTAPRMDDPMRVQSGAAISPAERASMPPAPPSLAAPPPGGMRAVDVGADGMVRPSPPVAPRPDTGVALRGADIGLRDPTTPVGSPKGVLEPGNVDLTNRPDTANPDGSHSSVRSMSFSDGKGAEILIPTVGEDGKVLTDDEAIAQYRKTGKHLGKFADVASADAFANQLHRQQAGELNRPAPTTPGDRARELLERRRRGTTLTGVR